MNKKVRIGIDVGGTFTDAVVIDAETYEVIAKRKIPTTHKEGVARGVVQIISTLMEENRSHRRMSPSLPMARRRRRMRCWKAMLRAWGSSAWRPA